MPMVVGIHGAPTNLRGYLRENALEFPMAVFLGAHAARGLAALHDSDLQVVHGDIKPENLLMHQGTPHLADFGSAFLHEPPSMGGFGTPDYLPPEALADGRITTRAGDVYSYGVILKEIADAVDRRGLKPLGCAAG